MSKPLIQSKSFWGWVVASLPLISEAAEKVLGSGFLPPQVVPIVAGAGALIGLIGRLVARDEIKGVISSR
jgi:hypothetical protein